MAMTTDRKKLAEAHAKAFLYGWAQFEKGTPKRDLPTGKDLALAYVGDHKVGIQLALRYACTCGFWVASIQEESKS